jgi:hypothetical protein
MFSTNLPEESTRHAETRYIFDNLSSSKIISSNLVGKSQTDKALIFVPAAESMCRSFEEKQGDKLTKEENKRHGNEGGAS